MTTPPPKLRWAIFIAIALLALALRLPQLGERPMHTDEAVNAFITGNLLAGETYQYDPQDKHGPVLFLFAKPIAQLCGAKNFSDLTETQLRLTPVLIGSAMILLFAFAVRMFGFLGCFVAALLFAVAPLPVYYSRYFIHETLFVAATFGLMLSCWQTLKNNSVWSAALTGLCAALMLACKETAVIHFFALACAAFVAWIVNRRDRATPQRFPPAKIIFTALAVFFVTTVLLFTWFGKNFAALPDLLHAIPRFSARAGGEGHAKPFTYYFHLLDPLFILTILAVAGIYAAICDAVSSRSVDVSSLSSLKGGEGRGEEANFSETKIPSPQPSPRLGGEREPDAPRKATLPLVIYALVVAVIYSAIPYKQPWLALNLWLPFTLLCGVGVSVIVGTFNSQAGRWGAGIAGFFLLTTLGAQTQELVFQKPAHEKNPFAYAHTTEDILGLPLKLEEICRERKISQPRIAVMMPDAWPLPWYLRKFSSVGYWQPGQEPGAANFFITTTDTPTNLTARLNDFRPEFFGVRLNVLVVLWAPPAKTVAP